MGPCGSGIGWHAGVILRLIVLAMALAVGSARAETCASDVIDVRDGDTTVRFSVEIADTPQERGIGLMNRDSMARFSGMLFVYEAPQTVAFWMRNTLIPLDMLFIDPRGVVTRIHENARPLDESSIPGGDGILYVLEINGGLSAALGLREGAEIRHPAVDPALAVWPCGHG